MQSGIGPDLVGRQQAGHGVRRGLADSHRAAALVEARCVRVGEDHQPLGRRGCARRLRARVALGQRRRGYRGAAAQFRNRLFPWDREELAPIDRGGLRGRRRNWRRDVADNKEGLDDPSGLSRSYEMRDHPHVFAEIPRGGAERCLQEQKAVERPRSRGRDLRSASSRGSRWRSVRCGAAFGFDLKGLETNRCDREASLGLMGSNSIIA